MSAIAPESALITLNREHLSLSGLPDVEGESAVADAAVYTSGVYIAKILTFFAAIIQRGLLGPTMSGYWTLVAMIWGFFGISSLGVIDAAMREIPAARTRGDFLRAAAVADTAGTFTVGAFALSGGTLALVALAGGGSWDPRLRYGLALMGVLGPLQALLNCHVFLYQVMRRFRVLALGLIASAALGLSLQTALVGVLGYWGKFAGIFAASSGTLLLWRFSGRGVATFRWRLRLGLVPNLAPIGAPIVMFSLIWTLFEAVDSLLVARFLDVRQLGYYGLALSTATYILFLPKSVAVVLFPRMQERYSAKGDANAIRHYAEDAQLLLALVVMPLFVGVAFFLLPVLIRQGLPAFAPAVRVVQISLAGTFLLGLIFLPIELLITTGRRWRLIGLMLAGVLLNGVANWFTLAVLHRGIVGAAVATALASLVLLVSVTVYALAGVLSPYGVARHVAWVLAAFIYATAASWATESSLPVGRSLTGDLGLALVKLVVYLVALMPVLAIAQYRYQALRLGSDGLRALRLSLRGRRPKTTPTIVAEPPSLTR